MAPNCSTAQKKKIDLRDALSLGAVRTQSKASEGAWFRREIRRSPSALGERREEQLPPQPLSWL
jgi:hypothetical protein